MQSKGSTVSSESKSPWHFTPDLPIKTSPYFSWPPEPRSIARWMVSGWFPLTERSIILALAIVATLFFHPVLERCVNFSIDWMAQIYFRNMILMCLVAGGLHLYFYTFRMQGDERRFDSRPLASNSGKFTFRSQVKDNMFWTLASGVTIWSIYEILMMWSLANGYAPALSPPGHLPWLILLIFLLPMWETTHFFLIHRLIHTTKLYQRVHVLHHRNNNVGPWSGLSMHPVEHLVFHLSYFTLSAATTHAGYQGIVCGGRLVLPLGTFHHQLHHRYFTCNYGGLETPWDQWTGSFHDGTARSHEQFLAKRKG